MADPNRVPSRMFPRIFLLLASVAALLVGAAPAGAALLHGVVYADGAPLDGATIDLLDAASKATLDSTATVPDGTYSFTVSPGAYDLRVNAEGYQTSSVEGIAVADGDVTQDVALISRPSLRGTVRTHEGVPVAGAQVELRGGDPSDEETWGQTIVGPVTTDAAGGYSFDPAPGGAVNLNVLNASDANPLFPESWHYWEGAFTVGLATVRDVSLPEVATVSGTTTGPDDVAAAGAQLVGGNVTSAVGWYARSRSRVAVSDAAGGYALRVFAIGATHVTATPPADSGWSAIEATFDVPGDTVRNFAFEPISLSGVIRTLEGAPVAGVQVEIRGGDPNDDETWGLTLAGPVATDSDGSYRLDLVPAGAVVLNVYNADDASALLPKSWHCWEGPFTIDRTSTRDLTLPRVATISGTARDAAAAPVSGAALEARNVASDTGWYARSLSRVAVTDASGAYAVRVFATGPTHLSAAPPAGRAWSAIEATLAVTGDVVRDVIFRRLVVAGTVRTHEGAPVEGAQVELRGGDPYDDLTLGSTLAGPAVTDAAGGYAIDLAPEGPVTINVLNAQDDDPLFPQTWIYQEGPFALGATLARDVALPTIASVSGKATDANGVPVPGVRVEAGNVASDVGWYARSKSRAAITDPAGAYVVRAFAIGHTAFTLTPPEGSGFASSAPVGFSLVADRLLNVVLMIDDFTPPVILAGPVASQVTDATAVIGWQTDEPARGGLLYGPDEPPGTLIAEEAFVTEHSVALVGLTADTLYRVSVFASDFAGNGPVASGIVSFRTLPAADAVPPVFIYGPIVSAVTHETAVVEWATDEAASGTVAYGTAEPLDGAAADATLAGTHRLVLEGLTPSTGYLLRVEAVDAAGNAVTSDTIGFTTLAAPDATPPVIVDGPLVIDISATGATVVWTTDEPATSGVSWNDGTHYGVASDPALVTSHSVTLTGLEPATAYTAIASSTDGAGNGPTLSAPLPFTTLAAPDTRPPVIIDGPTVVNVTHQSAVIRWETDEPADGVVEYGLAGDELTLRAAHATLTQSHNLTLTGLAVSTWYFFRVCSADAERNAACSAVFSFLTDAEGGPAGPLLVAGPQVAYRSDRTATVTWETDLPTDSIVAYETAGGPVLQRVDGAQVLLHSVTLKDLDPATAYAVRVSGADAHGQPLAAPPAAPGKAAPRGPVPELALTTAAGPDATAPVIVSGPTVEEVRDTRAVVRWVTDEIADSVVRYGRAGAPLGGVAGAIARTAEHRVVLTNLRPGRRHEVQVASTDPDGNGPTRSARVAFVTAPPPPLFAERFADGTPAGDGDWQVLDGSWSVAEQQYVSSRAANDVSRVAQLAPLAAGVISAKLTLTPAFGRMANGAVIFACAGPGRYRFVRLEAGRVVIGQVGSFGGVAAGAKRTIAVGVGLNRPRTLVVGVYPDGWVRVALGDARIGAFKFPSAVPGGVGLAAARAKTLFDDVRVWDAGAL